MAKEWWEDAPLATESKADDWWAEAPLASDSEPKGILASPERAQRISQMDEATDPTGMPAPRRESVLEGTQMPTPQFDPAEGQRLSSRAYAEETPIPGQPKTRGPVMSPSTGTEHISDATYRGSALQDAPMPVRAGFKAVSGIAQGVGGVMRAAGDFIGSGDLSRAGAETVKGAEQFGQGMGQIGSIEGFGPKSPAPYLSNMAEGATSSLAQSAAYASLFGAGAVIPLMSLQTAGQEYDQARVAGLDPAAALAGALPKGIFEAIGEKFTGLDKVAGAMGTLLTKGASDVAKKTASEVLIKAGIREVPGEVITYLGQTGVDLLPGIGLNPDLTMSQFVDGLRDTVVQAGMMGGTMGGSGAIVRPDQSVKRPPEAGKTSATDLLQQGQALPSNTPDPITAIGIGNPDIGLDEAVAAASAIARGTPSSTPESTDADLLNAINSSQPPVSTPTGVAAPTAPDTLAAPVPEGNADQPQGNGAVLDAAAAQPDSGTLIQPISEPLTPNPVAESQARAVSDSRDAGVAPGRDGSEPIQASQPQGIANGITSDQAQSQQTQQQESPAPAAIAPTIRQAALMGEIARVKAKAEASKAARAVASPAPEGLSVGRMLNSAEPVTVKDGIVHIGKHAAQNFDSGEDVKVAANATPEQIAVALRAAGAISTHSRIFGLDKPKPLVTIPVSQRKQATAKPEDLGHIGRDNIPVNEGGKQFKTKIEAQKAKKNQPMLRVKKVKEGYVLAPKTEAQIRANEAAAKRLGRPRIGKPGVPYSAHEFIARHGGLNPDARSDLGIEGNPKIGNRHLYARTGTGLTMERATEKLIEDGYLQPDALHEDARKLIRQSLLDPQYTPEGTERMAEAARETDFQDHLKAQQELHSSDPFAPLLEDGYEPEDAIGTGYQQASPEIKAEVAALSSLLDSMGIDSESVRMDISEQNPNATDQEYHELTKAALQSAVEEATLARSHSDSGPADGEQGKARSQEVSRPEFGLEADSPEADQARRDAARAAAMAESAKLHEARLAENQNRRDLNKAEKQRKAEQIVAERKAARDAEIAALQNPDAFEFGASAPEAPAAVNKKVSTEQVRGQQDVENAPAADSKPASEMSAAELLRAAADKMEAAAAPKVEPTQSAQPETKPGPGGTQEPLKATLSMKDGTLFDMVRTSRGHFDFIAVDGTKIGSMIYTDYPMTGGFKASGIRVDPAYQRKGVATAAYDFIEKNVTGKTFESAGGQSPSGAAFRAARKEANEPAAQEPTAKAEQPTQTAFSLPNDGIDGKEMPVSEVPNGNTAFQYAYGKIEEDGAVAIFRRKASERGTYGGWRWEADKPSAQASAQPAAKPAGKIEDDGVVFSRTDKGTPTLIIQHNLTEENLLHADRMGGIPVPSLAVTQAAHPLENFGEITLVGGSDMANPKGYAATKVFGADIYSPRYPRITYKFTPNMQSRGEGMLKDGLKATDSRIDWSEVANNGADELRRAPAIRWQVLTDNGIKPEIIRTEVKPLPEAIKPFANDTRHPFDLAQDPAFIEAAYKAHEADLVRAYDGDTQAAQEEIAQLKARSEERGMSYLVRQYANDINQHRMDSARSGAIDRVATNRMMESQIEKAGLSDKLEAYAKNYLRDVNPDEKLFQGYTNLGNRKYIPHTLDNVIKILKNDMRGGESFNYGLGTVRSRFTPQFRSITEIQNAKGRLMDENAFDKVKEEVGNQLNAVTMALQPYHPANDRLGFSDTVASTLYDSAKMGLPRALSENGFKDVPQEVKDQIAGFLGKLRNMPTAYFEAKILRAVDLSEFKGAVVPKGTSQKAIDALNRRGVTNIKHYDKNVTGDRAAKIQELTKESDLMFSRKEQGDKQVAPAAKTQATQQVEKLVNAIKAKWANAPEIVVAFDMSDEHIPERVRQEDMKQRSGGAVGTPEGFYYKGKVYLMSSQLVTPNDVARVLAHEALGHFGLRGMFGDALKPILQQIATMRKAEVDAKIKEYGLRSVNNLDRLTAAEEILAEMSQSQPELGFVKRAIAAIRNWLRANVPGFSNLKMTDNDIVQQYILPARGWVERGQGKAGGAAAFNRGTNEPMTNPDVVGNQGGRSADDIKTRVLDFAYNNKGIKPVQSDGMLAAIQNKTGRPIFVTKGNFGREQFKQAHAEAKAAGIDFDKMYVFADTATYSGPAISFMRLDEALPNEPTAPDSGGALFSKTLIAGDTGRYTPDQLKALTNIGQRVQVPTLKERYQTLTADLGKKLIQGTFDQFMPLKELGKVPYMLARLSKGASGAFDTLLHGGKLKLSDGVYDFDEQNKGGVLDKLLLPLQGEHHDFLRWVAANRAEGLLNEWTVTFGDGSTKIYPSQQAAESIARANPGAKAKASPRENLFGLDDIKAFKALSNGVANFDYTLPNGTKTRDRTLIYADALKTFNGFQKNVMDMYEQSGGVDPEVRSAFEREFYLPFYRVTEEDGGVRGGAVKSGLVRQDIIKKLKGGKEKLNFDLLDNTLLNWAALLDAAAKNRSAKSAIDTMAKLGKAIEAPEETARQMAKSIGNKEGVVWYMDQGRKRFFLVDDPYLLTAVTSLEYSGLKGPIMDTMRTFKHVLTVSVTASPYFKVRNLIRDSLQTIASGPISYNPAKNIAQGWKLTDPKSDAYFRLLSGGGTIHFATMYEGSEAKRVQALVDAGVDSSTILNSDQKIKALYRKAEKVLAAYNELGNRGEAVNRAALYDQLVKSGVSHAEASLQARDLMDFSMQGSFTSVRFLTQVVPFMNARLQGIYKLGRAAKADPRRFATVLGATAMFSLALLAAYHDDDDWKKRTEGDRNNFFWFKFGGVAYRIPKPFEVGAVATVAERMAEYIFDKEMTGKRFREQIMQIAGDQLALNPIPQMVKPILDIYANKDSFSGIPIESMGMDRLKPEYRFNDRTTMAARALSTAGNTALNPLGINFMSPVQVDHLVRGYFAWLGTMIVSSADIILRPATDQPKQASADMWKLTTGNMVSDLRDAPSRYVSNMFNQAREIEQAMGTYRALQKEGKTKEATEFLNANRETLKKYSRVEHLKQAEAKFNERIRMIERSAMDADRKREMIRAVNAQKDRIARLAQ